MTDAPTITLRDHSQPCEHEGTSDCYAWAGVWFCSAQGQGWACPGGRERTFREELALIETEANVVHVLVEVI